MNRQFVTVGIFAVAVLVVAGVVFTLLQEPDTIPEAEAPPPITGPERAEDARGVMAELEQSDSIDYDAAYERGAEFHEAGQLADAQVLYFFGARGGHADSAFALAAMNDPLHHSPETSLLPEPDPFQAYKWYTTAAEKGMEAANTRLEALKSWAETASEAGDEEAERLLLQWE